MEALLANKKLAAASGAVAHPPHNVIVLFDNSLSMQWDKLERSYEAMQKVLHSLAPEDRFNLLMFNSKVVAFQPAMSTATPVSLQEVTDFVRSSRLRGGTDLQGALEAGLAQCVPGSANNYLVLLTDGSATRGTILSGKLSSWYADKWKALPEAGRPKLFVLAVGDDANLPLLRMLIRNDGLLENVLSTEPTEFKLNAFIAKMNMNPIGQLGLTVSPQSALDLVYPFAGHIFRRFHGFMGRAVQERAKKRWLSMFAVREGDALGSTAMPICRRNLLSMTSCRASGPGRAWMRCSKRWSAKGKTRPASKRLSVWRANTSSLLLIHLFWPCRARSFVRA